jgi:hypothetical protein
MQLPITYTYYTVFVDNPYDLLLNLLPIFLVLLSILKLISLRRVHISSQRMMNIF